MITEIQKFKNNALALEIHDSFSIQDEELIKNLFEEKLNLGYKHVNILICMQELKISNVNQKAFWEESLWVIRNYTKIGNLAVVSHNKMVKALVPIDGFFFERLNKGFHERYFDISNLDEALMFISSEA